MSVIHINQKNFQSEVVQSDRPVLLDFWASWCGPCRMLSPVLDAIALEREDIKVCKVNVDEEPELASQFEIMSIPTVIVIENGEIRAKSLGAKPKDAILALLN